MATEVETRVRGRQPERWPAGPRGEGAGAPGMGDSVPGPSRPETTGLSVPTDAPVQAGGHSAETLATPFPSPPEPAEASPGPGTWTCHRLTGRNSVPLGPSPHPPPAATSSCPGATLRLRSSLPGSSPRPAGHCALPPPCPGPAGTHLGPVRDTPSGRTRRCRVGAGRGRSPRPQSRRGFGGDHVSCPDCAEGPAPTDSTDRPAPSSGCIQTTWRWVGRSEVHSRLLAGGPRV